MKKKLVLLLFLMMFIPYIYAEEAIEISEYESEETKEVSMEEEIALECDVNEAFLEWMELPDEEKKKYIMPEYCNLPEEGEEIYALDNAASYPSYYLAQSTPIKDQDKTGVCWAMTSSTVLESYWLKKTGQTIELSPGHLNYMESQSFYNVTNKHGNVRWVNDGGSPSAAAVYFINRYGPVLESTVPTVTNIEELPPVEYNTIWGKKNVLDVNNIQYSYRANYKAGSCTTTEKNRIKAAITKYGPVGAPLNIDQNKVNRSYNSYIFKTSSKNAKINHEVTIIGWDDNFEAYKFGGQAKNNGAWIVQNSWGTYFGKNGIFYVSYEDSSICVDLFSIRSADTNFSDNKYITSERTNDTYAPFTTALSVFNKKKNGVAEKLNKVSFQTIGGTKYKVYYYKGNAAKKNKSTKKMTLIASGTANYTGYVTIKPKKTITIPASTSQYSIVVVLSNKKMPITKNVVYAYDGRVNKYRLFAAPDSFKKGVSYVYYRGKWRDLYNLYSDGKYKIVLNAFTDNITLDVTKTSVNYYKEDFIDINFTVKAKYNTKMTKVEVVKDGNILMTTGDMESPIALTKGQEEAYYFRKEGLTGFKNGTYTVKVYLDNGTVRTRTVKINVIPISGVKITNKTGLKLGVGKTLQMNATLSPTNFNSINPTITWSSSNTSLATVDQNGLVTGVNVGNVSITATTMNGKTYSYDLIIDRPIESIYLSNTSLTLDVNETYTSSASVRPRNTTDDKTVTWYSESTRASVNNGVITANRPGKVKLYVKAINGVTNYIDVSVVGVALKEDNITIELGDTYDSEPVVISKSTGVSQSVILTSSNPSVVRVENNRYLIAAGLGTATIDIQDMYGRRNTATVTVTKISASRFTTSSVSNKTYNGKTIKPGVSVSFNGKTLKKGTDYTISYKNNKNPGKATISINATSKSIYKGSKKVYFIIKPKKVTINTPTTSSKSIKASWKKHTGVSGYQVSYRVKGSSTWKSFYVSGTSKKITKLTKNKYYQVKVRAYKNVDGTKYYGAWSKTKTIKCK